MKVCIETITPNVAKEYLSKNTNNYRSVIPHVVNRYAKDISEGLWEENGNAIAFSKSGILLDGQHRLNAIIKANKPVNMVVVRDIDDQASTFDYQTKRTDTQILKASGIGGYARSLQASALASILLCGTFNRNSSASKETSVKQKRIFLEANEVEVDAVAQATFCGDKKLRCSVRAAVFCAAWCLFVCGESCESLKEFFSVVNSGFPISGRECSPCIVLRNNLVNTKGSYQSHEASMERDFNTTIRAYLDFKNGVRRKVMYQMSPVSRKYFNFACMKAQEDVEEEIA